MVHDWVHCLPCGRWALCECYAIIYNALLGRRGTGGGSSRLMLLVCNYTSYTCIDDYERLVVNPWAMIASIKGVIVIVIIILFYYSGWFCFYFVDALVNVSKLLYENVNSIMLMLRSDIGVSGVIYFGTTLFMLTMCTCNLLCICVMWCCICNLEFMVGWIMILF